MPRRTADVATHRDIQIVAQETAQGHVPAAPERGDVPGLVRTVEIQRKSDTQHPSKPDRHIGVSGEVEIDLQRIAKRRVPGLEERKPGAVFGGAEADVGKTAEHVGQHQLLAKP